MRSNVYWLLFSMTLAVIGFRLAPVPVQAENQTRPALEGQVTSQEEGPMEGVVISAKGDGSTITVSVMSDKQGHYSFPGNRLGPGPYALKIRAVSYDPAGRSAVDKVTTADLKLRETKNIASQLINAEWLRSMPGTDEQKLPHPRARCEVDP